MERYEIVYQVVKKHKKYGIYTKKASDPTSDTKNVALQHFLSQIEGVPGWDAKRDNAQAGPIA